MEKGSSGIPQLAEHCCAADECFPIASSQRKSTGKDFPLRRQLPDTYPTVAVEELGIATKTRTGRFPACKPYIM